MQSKTIWAALALLCAATPAFADDCKPLQILASFPITPLGPLSTIPVTLNGVEKHFLFDTGGALPQVSASVAEELKLPHDDSAVHMFSADGKEADTFAIVDKFQLGNFPPGRMEMPVSQLFSGLDGIFVPTIFKKLDFEMDFAAGKINALSADHCEGKVIYWPFKALAVVPVTLKNNHMMVPVTVDGHDFQAMIDTGASTSIMRLDVAKLAFDLTPDSPDMKAVGTVNGNEKTVRYTYPFKSLAFEGIAVTNPKIQVIEDFMGEKSARIETGSHVATKRVELPDVIIGMDVLRKLHLYLAQDERKLYMTEANTAAPASPKP